MLVQCLSSSFIVWFHYWSLHHKTCLVQYSCLIQYAPTKEHQPHTSNKGSRSVENVMSEERNDPMVWGELCLGAELKWQPVVGWNPAWGVYL